jgi:hypothetical protein
MVGAALIKAFRAVATLEHKAAALTDLGEQALEILDL